MQGFLCEYKQKYVLFVRVYAHTKMYTCAHTNICTHTPRNKSEKKHPCGLYSKQEFTQAVCSSWPRCHSCIMSGIGAEAVQWQQFYQPSERGNFLPAEPVRALLSLPPITTGSCIPCMLLLLSLALPMFWQHCGLTGAVPAWSLPSCSGVGYTGK